MTSAYTALRKKYPRTWRIWYRMNRRCQIGQNGDYVDVQVCRAWDNQIAGQDGFLNFFHDMGPSEGKLEIDRINPFGDYEPLNCRWVTREVNQQNSRKRMQGDYKWLDTARANGIERHTFYGRLYRGWNAQDAATLPPAQIKYKKRVIK